MWVGRALEHLLHTKRDFSVVVLNLLATQCSHQTQTGSFLLNNNWPPYEWEVVILVHVVASEREAIVRTYGST